MGGDAWGVARTGTGSGHRSRTHPVRWHCPVRWSRQVDRAAGELRSFAHGPAVRPRWSTPSRPSSSPADAN
jgi:hypothetical protein